ncbi:MAG: RNA polymerase sigma factor [Planctomycetota bacterium]
MSDKPPQPLTLEQFAERFERAAPVLWCVAAAVVRSRDTAEDVVQDAAVHAMARLTTFEPGTNFTAWMTRIVRFTALNQVRRTQKGPRLLDPEGTDPEAPSQSSEFVSECGALLPDQAGLDDRVVAGLNSLNETERACLLLRTVLELSYREIGSSLDIPQGTAMSHVHRARQHLAAQLRRTPSVGVENTR